MLSVTLPAGPHVRRRSKSACSYCSEHTLSLSAHLLVYLLHPASLSLCLPSLTLCVHSGHAGVFCVFVPWGYYILINDWKISWDQSPLVASESKPLSLLSHFLAHDSGLRDTHMQSACTPTGTQIRCIVAVIKLSGQWINQMTVFV